MNITSQNYAPPIQTAVNLQTDSLRRENQQREVIAKPEAASHSAAEKGVASDKERGRTPAQNNEQVDFANLRKQAEHASDSIDDGSQSHEHSSQGGHEDNTHASSEAVTENESKEDSGKSDSGVFAEQREIKALQSRDQEVRAHEMAHAAVGGPYTGTPNYSFEQGPDGKKYAVEGDVSVDVAPIEGDPKATIAKMQKVHAAALAPASPSSQDIRVAASASRIIAQAQAELATADTEDSSSKNTTSATKSKDIFAQDNDGSELLSNAVSYTHLTLPTTPYV